KNRAKINQISQNRKIPTTTEEMHKSSEPPPPTSFSSLPEDIALNCLARILRFYTSLVHTLTNPKPTVPYQHLESSTVVSTGSEIYIIGGYFEGKRSTRVLVLDCPSHQLRRLPNMRLSRESAAADVIDGRIYVIGGPWSDNIEDWGEAYDPKTQTWEPLLPTTLDLTTQKSVVPGRLVMGGKVYIYDDIGYMPELRLEENNVCLVEIDNMMCQVSVCKGVLPWYDLKWSWVRGLEGLLNSHFPCYLVSVANYDRGSRVTVWWESVVFGLLGLNYWTKECKKEIWCAEISLERRGSEELWGFVEWSKNVVTFDGCDSPSDFFLHSAIVTY
ncbi:putative F-box/kelch-repeat protein At3g46050, partial [Arabidopsis lyrata subsp. lyrata]|uniref:putative F-box/kelch-repeat protein At3g46050 n=1 Tax=Arabidopsis lyrata subsp. lyrata TaxID=81972 RepID=UPI000A29C86C